MFSCDDHPLTAKMITTYRLSDCWAADVLITFTYEEVFINDDDISKYIDRITVI